MNVTTKFAVGLLHAIGAPIDHANVASLNAWAKAEGGHFNGARFNFFNTRQGGFGGRMTPGGFGSYPNLQAGIQATAHTLHTGSSTYGPIIGALRSSNPGAFARAVGASQWGTSGAGLSATLGPALRENYGVPRHGAVGLQPPRAAHIGRQMAMTPGQRRVSTSHREFTTQHTDFKGALTQALMQPVKISGTGEVPLNDPLARAMALVRTGQYTTTVQHIINSRSTTLEAGRMRGAMIVAHSMQHGGGGKGPGGTTPLQRAVNLALRAVQVERQFHSYHYTQGGGRTNEGRGPIAGRSITFDCSGFVDALYRAAGMRDPSGHTGYAGTIESPSGPAGQLLDPQRMAHISPRQAVPGDIVLFPDHVTIYVGHGRVVSMGQEGDPILTTVAAEAAAHGVGGGYFIHMRGAR